MRNRELWQFSDKWEMRAGKLFAGTRQKLWQPQQFEMERKELLLEMGVLTKLPAYFTAEQGVYVHVSVCVCENAGWQRRRGVEMLL